jgi:hypothetical protein
MASAATRTKKGSARRAPARAAARPKPQASLRRFDVFAEYNRQEAMRKGLRADEARGYGLWLAKIVAARRFGRMKAEPGERGAARRDEPEELVDGKWRTLSGEPQTDKLFEKEIVDRMGRTFYRRVFAPAIRAARERGASYEAIRDSLRRELSP